MNTTDPIAPLAGLRVLNLGGSWAGRVASLLMAEQGAEVIEIERPGRAAAPEDALLGRGKTLVPLDLADARQAAPAARLASDADIVFDNLGAGRARRFGLDEDRIRAANPGVVYVSIPGFASGSPQADVAAWEGTVAAATGVYTSIHSIGPLLGDPPVFMALPMVSAYAGVHAAVAASAGLVHRLRTGAGMAFEVPLADAVVSALALQLLDVEDAPARFDMPPGDPSFIRKALPILRALQAQQYPAQRAAVLGHLGKLASPQFGPHRCADGRLLFINAVDHLLHAPAGLQAMGLLQRLLAEGMVIGSPYLEGGEGNNLCAPALLSPQWVARMRTLMAQRFLDKPAAEWEQIFRAAGVPATVVRTAAEWLTWPPARAGGLVTELDDAVDGAVTQPGRFASIESAACASPPLRSRRLAPDAHWHGARIVGAAAATTATGKPLAGLRVLDLSNVIAGPAAARVFAELGAEVIRIDPPAPFAGPRMTMWFGIDVNQGKRAIILDLKSPQGRELLARLVRQADAVIHNFLDRSAESLGISAAQLQALNPDIVSCQVSAWGGPDGGPLKDDPAFDPVLQSATGITARYGSPLAPALHGLASCVDYITGFTAALGVLQALVARKLGRGGAHVRTSLAMGAQMVQFPFMAARNNAAAVEEAGPHAFGSAAHYRPYALRDGHAFLACRPADLGRVAARLGAPSASAEGLATALSGMRVEDAAAHLQPIAGASLVAIRQPDELRAASTLDDGEVFDEQRRPVALVRAPHPSGHRVTLPLPTWYRSPSFGIRPLSAAPAPGQDTRAVLADRGMADSDLQDLLRQGVIGERWQVLRHYLPR